MQAHERDKTDINGKFNDFKADATYKLKKL